MTDTFDPFHLGSGLREEYILTIDASSFGFDANYNDGRSLLWQVIGHDEASEPVSESYSVGGDWQSHDGGKTIQNPKGERSTINRSSNYGRFLAAALELDGVEEVLRSRGTPMQASIWDDMIFRLQRKSYTFKIRGEESTSERMMPVEYMGLQTDGGVQPSPAASAAVSPAERIAAARAARLTSVPSDENPLIAQLYKLAVDSPSFDDFVTAAFDIDDVLTDDDLSARVVDANDIYAKGKAAGTTR